MANGDPKFSWLDERIYKNVQPLGYSTKLGNILPAVGNVITGGSRQPVGRRREDLWRYSLGGKEPTRSFNKSQYRPTQSKEENATYYTPKDYNRQELLNRSLKALKDKNRAVIDTREGEGMLGLTFAGDMTVSKGQDERGKYVSFYDKWDLNNPLANKFLDRKPEIYDRVYYGSGNNVQNNYKIGMTKEINRVKKQKGGPVGNNRNVNLPKEVFQTSIGGHDSGVIKPRDKSFNAYVDRAIGSFRQNVPEAYRMMMPGLSDIEDAAYLKEAYGSEGTIRDKIISAAALALPAVGSRALKTIPTNKLPNKVFRGIESKKADKVLPENLLDPGEVKITSNVLPGSATSSNKSIADAFSTPNPVTGDKGLVNTYKVKRPFAAVTEDEAANYLHKIFKGKNFTKGEAAQALRKEGIDAVYDDAMEEAQYQFLNTDVLDLSKSELKTPNMDFSINKQRIRKNGGFVNGQLPEYQWGGAIQGAMSGAAAGSPLGPWGMAGGALVGGVGGYMGDQGPSQQDIMQQEMQRRRDLRNMPQQQFQNAYSSPYQMQTGGMAPNRGGTPMAPRGRGTNAELEKGETYMTPRGEINSVPQGTPTHAQGGQDMRLPPGTQVLGELKNSDDERYKDLGRRLEKAYNNYKKIIKGNPTPIAKRTAEKNLIKVQKEYMDLMQEQEEQKMAKGGEVNKSGESGENYLVSADETEGGDPKYPVDSKEDVKDAWHLRNHAKGLKISKETLASRIKSKAKSMGVDLPTDEEGNEKKQEGGTIDYASAFEGMGSLDPILGRDYSIDPSSNQYYLGRMSSPQPPQAIQQSGEEFDWGTTGTAAAGVAGQFAPTLYNIGRGIFGETADTQASYQPNPYRQEVLNLMRGSRYDATPQLRQANMTARSAERNLRETAPSSSQYLANLANVQAQSTRAQSDILSQKQNMDNQYRQQQAQMMQQMGSQEAQRRQQLGETNLERGLRTQAAQDNLLSAGLGQLSQGTRGVMQDIQNRRNADMMRQAYNMYLPNYNIGRQGELSEEYGNRPIFNNPLGRNVRSRQYSNR